MSGIPEAQMCGNVLIVNPTIGIEKRCKRCGRIKYLSEFTENKKCKNGRSGSCKKCSNENHRKWNAKNREKTRERCRKQYAKYPEMERERCRKWRAEHREYIKEVYRKGMIENAERIRDRCRKWQARNPEKTKASQKKANAKIRNTPKGKLNLNIRSGIWRSIRGEKCWRHWEDLVQYTIDQLKRHLEKQFTSEMTWENYGSYWHIDHKIPISAFNFGKPEDFDFKQCWALKNLRPLEARENIIKNAKIEKQFQPSLILRGQGEKP